MSGVCGYISSVVSPLTVTVLRKTKLTSLYRVDFLHDGHKLIPSTLDVLVICHGISAKILIQGNGSGSLCAFLHNIQ